MTREVVTVSFEVLHKNIPGAEGKRVTQYERRIYWMLHHANGGIVSIGALWDGLYGHLPESDWPDDDSSVRVLISRLKRKCHGVKIINHRGMGYSMEAI